MGTCIDMQFLLECSTYKLHKRREIPYLQAAMYYSVYYINILMTTFLTIFRGFPNTFRRFSKILQNDWSKGGIKVAKHFQKISEDFRRFEEDRRCFHSQVRI